MEQDFNSLDAQRESCEAFIQSQAHEGWSLYKKHYDDGGISGGTLERLALQTLLSDIRIGRVNVIVVYKIDRLTRSLIDFARLVEIFDQHKVSFVSVTQHFNTTSSMGRLTLNVLLSFAQYEREVTGERIRDKFLASRKKGMWMGGHPPLGYDLKDQKLWVNQKEAKEVNTIFNLYLKSGGVGRLKGTLDQTNIRSKKWVSAKGNRYGGKLFSRGSLYQILQNRLYIGEAVHKGKSYPGEHDAIIDHKLWEKVQKTLQKNRQKRTLTQSNLSLYPLKGLLLDENGDPFVGSYSQKQDGRRYRYYNLCSKNSYNNDPPPSPLRISAKEIEDIILKALRDHPTLSENLDWETARSAIKDIRVRKNTLKIKLTRRSKPSFLEITFQAQKKGNQTLLIGPNGQRGKALPRIEQSLVKAVTKAWAWRQEIVKGNVTSFGEIAQKEGCTEGYIRKLLPLSFLSPEIIEAILRGEQPRHLTLANFTSQKIPASWDSQRHQFNF